MSKYEWYPEGMDVDAVQLMDGTVFRDGQEDVQFIQVRDFGIRVVSEDEAIIFPWHQVKVVWQALSDDAMFAP